MSTAERVRVRRKRSAGGRLMRRLRRVSKIRAAVVLAMVLAAAGVAAALVILISGSRPQAAPPLSSAPLALDPRGLRRLPPMTTRGVPLTVRLEMPAVGIDLKVVQGDGVTVPMNLASHYPGTDQPGAGSNALFYAHAQPGMFQAIYQLHKGDVIRALRADGSEVDYQVSAFEYVSHDDFSVIKPTPYDQITLLTCTSYNPYTPRFIVIGTPETS